VKLKILGKTLTVIRNPFALLFFKGSEAGRSITFRNGLTYCLTWSQFRTFRDNYQFFKKYKVIQLQNDLFKIGDKRSEVVCSSTQLSILFDLMQDYSVHQENGVFHLKNQEVELFGSLEMLSCIRELRTGEYEYDYKGKVVLDIGGFEGESAAYFWLKGAKKIIIYEPLETHIEFIKKNVLLNHIEAEIHHSGIGDQNGTQTIQYSETDPGFGILCKGPKRIEINITDISKVIGESEADVGKFDCEGAEKSLVHVSSEILQKISYYIIEVHSVEIRKAVLEKFEEGGFTLEKEIGKPGQFSVLAFKRTYQPLADEN
jgi:FkbM family methyltransferase